MGGRESPTRTIDVALRQAEGPPLGPGSPSSRSVGGGEAGVGAAPSSLVAHGDSTIPPSTGAPCVTGAPYPYPPYPYPYPLHGSHGSHGQHGMQGTHCVTVG